MLFYCFLILYESKFRALKRAMAHGVDGLDPVSRFERAGRRVSELEPGLSGLGAPQLSHLLLQG